MLKIFSDTITHKTDVGGVKLNLQDEAAVRTAYQSIQSSVAEKVGDTISRSHRAADGQAGWLRVDPG